MSNSNGGADAPDAGLSKYQEALKRLKSETEEAAPDSADAAAAPPAREAEGTSDEPVTDSTMSFLDDIAAEHGLTDAPAPAEAAPPASETEAVSAAPPAEDESPVEDKSPAKMSDDSMDAYLKSLNKLRAEKGAAGAQAEAEEDEPQSAADALKAARGMTQETGETADRKVDKRYQQAAERLKDRSSVQEAAQKKPRRVPALRGVLHGKDDCAPCAPGAGRRKAKAKAKAKAADAGGSRLAGLPPIALQAGVGFVVLALGLLLQFAVFLMLDTPFVFRDLLAGVSAVLPVGLVLALSSPETDRDWRAVIGGAAALGLTASLALALCLAVTYSAPLADKHIVVVVFLQLGILTMLLGPVILAVAAWLHRLELIELTDPLFD